MVGKNVQDFSVIESRSNFVVLVQATNMHKSKLTAVCSY